MDLPGKLMALAPESSELEELRSHALSGNESALESYAWWTVWRALLKDRNSTKREAINKFRTLMRTTKLKVSLDG